MKHNIHPSLLPLAMPIDEIHLDPANARTGHNVERIAGSLALYGQRKPIVVNRNEANKTEAGNGTLQAARSLGWTHVAAVLVEDEPSVAIGFAIADNRTAELSQWDYEALQALVGSLDPDLGLVTGFEGDELEEEIDLDEEELNRLEAVIEESIQQIERGEFYTADEVMSQLRALHGR